MPERVKLALIGCGGMGRRHLRGITRLSQSLMANLELVAVCDLNDATWRRQRWSWGSTSCVRSRSP